MVQEEEYLFQLYRYIELNPVRANMVDDPANYTWSSYQVNGLGKISSLRTPHPLYLALASDKQQRQVSYRCLFTHQVEGKLLDDIRKSINKGMAIGTDRFKLEIETLTGRRMKAKKIGRPEGWKKENF